MSHWPGRTGEKGKDPGGLKGHCMDSHMSVLALGLPSLQVVGGWGCGERGRQLCPGGGQKDVVLGRAGGDPRAAGEVSPRQLLPERGVRLSHPDLSTPFLANVTRSSTSNWVTGLPLLSVPFLPGL